jgi:hypothetical protein
MQSGTLQKDAMSYGLYKNLADELCAPIDAELDLPVRLELYESKLVYLRNLYAQAFRDVNGAVRGEGFADEDLVRIRQFISVTEDFMHKDALSLVSQGLQKADDRRSAKAA